MGELTDDREVLAFDPHQVDLVKTDEAAGSNVLALLTDSTSDEWHRRWEVPGGPVYEQMGIVETYDLARSSTATTPTTHVVDSDLAVTTVQRPVDLETLTDLVDRHLEGWADSEGRTVVYVESFDAFHREGADDAFVEAMAHVLEASREIDATVRMGFDAAAVPARTTVRICDQFETVVGAPLAAHEAVAALKRLRQEDPTNFGYFRRHWRDALRALDASTRTYPQAKQLHEDADLPDASPRTLGAALSALERLDALALWGDTVGANRYDLTSYDSERAAALGIAVESLPE